MNIFDVVLSKRAIKDLECIPSYIAVKLHAWIDDISYRGLREVQKTPGYHDEPLRGDRDGERSIKLSKSYRAFYVIDEIHTVHFIKVIEVNKHDY